MNADDLRAAQTRAVQMRQLAEAPGGLFEIMDQVRTAYLETIADSRPEDGAGREAIYHRIKAHDEIVKVMRDVIREGANAAKMIDALTKQAEKKVANVA